MGQYRSLILGCGPRAHDHAEVYARSRDGTGRRRGSRRGALSAFTAKLVSRGFTDYETALAEVQPDIVHVVTQPARRV